MSMWMTSGASRLKAKQGQTFAARAQSRSRVMNAGRLLSSNRTVIARNPNAKRRKRIVVGEKATSEKLQPSAQNRREGISVTVRYDDNRSKGSTGRSSYVPPNNAPLRFRRDPPPAAAESPYYSSERVNPRQLSYRGAAPHPSVRRDESYAVSSPYASSSVSSFAGRHLQDRSFDHRQVPRASRQYHGPSAGQHSAMPMRQPEYPPPQDYSSSYQYDHSYTSAPQQLVQEAPLETPRHGMVDEYGRVYGHVDHKPPQKLTPFQRYLRSPARLKQHHSNASSSRHHVQRLPSVPEQLPSVHQQPQPFMLDEANPQDYEELYYPENDFFQMEEESPLADRALNRPAQQFGQHSQQQGASPLNRKRLFDSSRRHQPPPGIQGGHLLASASDDFVDFGAFDSAQDPASANPFLDRDSYGEARKKPRLGDNGDMSDFDEPNPNPLRFAFGSGSRKPNGGGGGIAKFQRPRPSNHNAHVAPPSSMHGYTTRQDHDVTVSETQPYQQYSGSTDFSSAPQVTMSDRIGQRENLPPRRQGEPIRYFNNGMEVDMSGRPLPSQRTASEQVVGF